MFSHPHDERDGRPETARKIRSDNHTDKTRPPSLNAAQPALPPNYLLAHPFPHGHPQLRDEVDVSGVWERRDEATIRNEIDGSLPAAKNIDIQIGRVLKKLEEQGELDNTYIFYTADHGIGDRSHGLQGKQNLYEHTWRVPFIVRGPGIKPNSRLWEYLSAGCAGHDVRPDGDGSSRIERGDQLPPVLEGKQSTIRDVLYGPTAAGTKPGMRCVKQGTGS